MGQLLWDSRYECGIDFIDRQHRYLLETAAEIRNEFGRINDYALHGLTRRLLDYTEFHFTAEEALIGQRFPEELAAHREEHQAIRAYLAELWETRDQLTAEELFVLVAEWVARHVMGGDTILRQA